VPGAPIPKTFPQVTEEKEGNSNAGGPAEGNDANAHLVKSILQQITGILKTPLGQAQASYLPERLIPQPSRRSQRRRKKKAALAIHRRRRCDRADERSG
jgi:hypothetical protein